MSDPKPWFVYIVNCADQTLYTGITTNLSRRIDEHNQGHCGARYTRSRRPVQLVYAESTESRSAASQREWQIKQMSRDEKQQLIKTLHNLPWEASKLTCKDPADSG